jgi:hypothetical protein
VARFDDFDCRDRRSLNAAEAFPDHEWEEIEQLVRVSHSVFSQVIRRSRRKPALAVSVPRFTYFSYQNLSGSYDHRIRADMLYFTSANDGGVFATGSAGFAPALPVDNFDNNCSRVLTNILNAFIKDGMLPGQRWISDEKQWR